MSITIRCAICGKPIELSASHAPRRATCSKPCKVKWQRHFEIKPGQLLIEVWTSPATIVAQSYGVSDKAIEKRCKRLCVVKPPRGYWAKVQNGIPHKEALLELGWTSDEIKGLDQSLMQAAR